MASKARSRPATLRQGAVSGGVATIAMSAVMFAAKRAGLIGEMPPEKITARALDRIGWRGRGNRAQDALASAAHVGFGAAAGAVFAAAEGLLRMPAPPVITGMAFGSAVWFVSYAGWVPALGIMPPPTRDRPGRPAAMLLAHLVYGAALGGLLGRRPTAKPEQASA